MDVNKVGQAIAYLRKRAGYTQKDLAERLGITDKAVSKWERGISLPDISLIGKLSILLDTDFESLASGDVESRAGWAGLIYLKDSPCNIHLNTTIYNKPMVYFLMGYCLLMGIRDIVIASDEYDQRYIESEFGNGEKLGINLVVCNADSREAEAALPESCTNVMTVLDRSFIYGVDQTRFFQRAMADPEHITVLSMPKHSRASKIYFNEEKQLVDTENPDLVNTQYDYFEIPVCFTPRKHLSSVCRGEAPDEELVYTEVLDRGYVEISLDDWDNVNDASTLVRIIEKKCGMLLYCPEEIAWRRGLISYEELRKLGEEKSDSDYGKYLLGL